VDRAHPLGRHPRRPCGYRVDRDGPDGQGRLIRVEAVIYESLSSETRRVVQAPKVPPVNPGDDYLEARSRTPFKQTRRVLPSWAMTPQVNGRFQPKAPATRTAMTAKENTMF